MTDQEIALRAFEAAAPYMDRTVEMAQVSRDADSTRVRFAVMQALWRRGWTLTRIARAIGRDHSTVSHGLKKAAKVGRDDERYQLAAVAAVRAVQAPAWEMPAVLPPVEQKPLGWPVPVPIGAMNG